MRNAGNCIRRRWFPVVSGSCFCWQAAWKVVNDFQIPETLLVMAAWGAALFCRPECQCILFCPTNRKVLPSWITLLLIPDLRCSNYALAWGLTSSELAKKPFCRWKRRYLLELPLFAFEALSILDFRLMGKLEFLKLMLSPGSDISATQFAQLKRWQYSNSFFFPPSLTSSLV